MAFQYIDWRDLADGGDSVENVLDKMQSNMEEAYYKAHFQGKEVTFFTESDLVISTGVDRRYFFEDSKITHIRASVDTPPSGAPIIVDINVNKTSIFTEQNDRPTILAGEETTLITLPDGIFVTEGDFLTIDIDQVGDTTPGANLSVQIKHELV